VSSAASRLITPGYRAASLLARKLPEPITDGLASVAGRAMPRFSAAQRVMAARHQQRLAGGTLSPTELQSRVDQVFRSYARYWVDMMRTNGASTAEVEAGIRAPHAAIVDRALEAGNGAIMAMPHVGAWDYGGTWVAHRWGLTTVAERVEPPELFEWFTEQRRRNRMDVVALDDPNATTALIGTLRRNGVVGLLCDRDLAGGGIPVTFFGEQTTMPAGPAMLSLRTGAAIIPNVVYQRDGYVEGVIKDPIPFERSGKLRADIAALTQLVANELEAMIAAEPTQWHVLQPVWPSDPGYRTPSE
jgi:phosphatidylinositol dimannoside acyltransferase